MTVLITGETGTGKDVAAHLLHHHSRRRNRSFTRINCAAIPDELIEGELFGHERGAYTGADQRMDGKLVAGNGGTVFLDEIGDLSQRAQAKVLCAIENKVISRVGGTREIPLDIRFVAATNKDLRALVRRKVYREDLFYRLAIGEIEMPPLRDRKDDLPLLVEHFLNESAWKGGEVHTLSKGAWCCLRGHSWPGNVRELRNAVESACANALSSITSIEVRDLPKVLQACAASAHRERERERVLAVLESCGGNKLRAAEVLRCHRSKIYRALGRNGRKDGPPASSSRPSDMGLKPAVSGDRERAGLEQAIIEARGKFSPAAAKLGIGRTTFWRWRKKHGIE